MSDVERTPAPRRSAREKKIAQPFTLSTPTKRKRVGDGEEDQGLSDIEMPPLGESDEEDDYLAPRKPKAGAKAKTKVRGTSAPKKPRATRTVAATPKTPARRGRKAAGGTTGAARIPAEAKITDDNALFNAIMNPVAALQSTIEDFLDSFQQSPEAALADLITCVLRACGSNDTVDADRAVDYDGVVDALDDFTEVLKEDEAPTYPLTSKHPMFKKFRKSLSEFLMRLVQASAELGILYSSDLLMTIQAWVVAMSSSQLRSFRHTATVIALEIETALCDVAAAVEKEAELVARQREGERKRKATKTGSSGREKEFEAKAAEVKERRAKLAEYLKEFFDGVFIHRYRDLDPNIRAECVHAMGDWLRKFPAHFLDGQYLRYIGWVLSDPNTHVRLEAVKALVSLYVKEDFIVSLQSFTERFKPRLVEMATGDTEIAVRVAVVQVLGAVDGQGLLDEEQRSSLCLLVFDKDAKVRRAVSGFVRGVWEDATEQRLVGKKSPSEKETDRAGLKALAQLLVQWGRSLDRSSAESGEDLDGESSSQGEPSASGREISTIFSAQQKSRVALAIEALWEEVELVNNWEAMLDLLLLDHSAGMDASQGATPVSSRRKKTKKTVDDALVDDAWRLEEAEEAILLDVFVATLRKTKVEATMGKKGEEEAATSEITRELIKSLPSLIAKHQTDENRIANVLLIPALMNIDMYLEMRMITAYESLWDDVSKQFTTHSSAAVLTISMAAIRHFMNATSLSNTNSIKIIELEDELASSLRDAVGGRDELEVANFSDDEAHSLGAICARLCILAGERDLTAWMEEDEGGKQSSAWDIICALAERGRLGYKEEEMMVDRALQLLSVHVLWKARHYVRSVGTSDDEEQLQESVREQRDVLLEKLVEYAIGTQSNTLLGVRRVAFQNLLTLYTLFYAGPDGAEKQSPLSPLAISMSDEVQYRCAGFVQAEIERFAEELEADRPSRDEENDDGSDSSSDTASEAPEKKKRLKKGKGKTDQEEANVVKSKALLEQEYVFTATMSAFLRALSAGAIHIRHGALLLAHYGRLGTAIDLASKQMFDLLREEGQAKDNGQLVAEVIVDALKESFTLVLDRIVETEQSTLALAKALTPCLLTRGAHLAVVRKLPGEHVVEIHTTLLSWITKKISAYETTKNKRSRVKSILFFKALQHLLIGIDSKDALKIKAHLDQDIAMLNLEIPSTSKAWEPYRAYEKRLTNVTTKEKGLPSRKGAKGATKTAEFVTTDDDEEEVEGLVETNGVSSQPAAPRVRPRPRPAYGKRPSPSQNGTDDNRSELTPLTGDERTPEPEREPEPEPEVETSQVFSNGAFASPVASPSPAPFQSTPAVNRTPAKKRARSPGADVESAEEDADVGAASPAPTQASEVVVRRKRVRH